MPKVIQNRFDGGHAEDPRSHYTNESQYSRNFDIFTNPHYLQPYRDSVAEEMASGNIEDFQLDTVILANVSGTQYLVSYGNTSDASAIPRFFYKSGLTDQWSAGATAGGGGSVLPHTLVKFRGEAYGLSISSTTVYLWKMVDTSTTTNIGTFTATISGGTTIIPRPFVHPEDNILYIIAGSTIAKYDGSSLTSHTSILPTGFNAVQISNFGGYLSIAMNDGQQSENTRTYLWGRDTTINTLQAIIDFGEGVTTAMGNIEENIVAVVMKSGVASSTLREVLEVKVWGGGEVQTVKSIEIDALLDPLYRSFRRNDKMYFPLNNAKSVFVVGKNKNGNWFISEDRYIADGAGNTTPTGLSFVGDYMFIGTSNILYRTTNAFAGTSVFRTTINPSMPLQDRYLKKKLRYIGVAYTGVASGNLTVTFSGDGSADKNAINLTTTAVEGYIFAENYDDGTQFGDEFREFEFEIQSTNGVKVKEICYAYDIVYEK